MKKFLTLFAVTTALLFASLGQAAEKEALPWKTDLAAAQQESAASKKPILVDFTGSDWCVWCQRLHQEVFSQKEFSEFAAQKYVLLQLDFPKKKKQPEALAKQNNALLDKYNVDSFPTVLVVDANGKELGRTGYVEGGAPAFIKVLREFAAK